ncbi:MAG: N-acetylneuraminate lyase [Clostridia bacterium]|nr:N-acetylneuraminate lyase [Clostridia bacterium]
MVLPSGVIPALPTPFDKNDNVDLDALGRLIEFTLKNGVSGFYVTGSTGEAFLLSDEERRAVLKFVAGTVGKRATLIAHVGCMSTKKACELGAYAASLGYDLVSSVAPIYYSYSFAEIKKYYFDVADAAGVPMLIYNIPALSGVHFSVDNIAEFLSDVRFAGVKHTSSDYFVLRQIRTAFPDKALLNGYDETFLAGLSMGADGAIGSTFNFMPDKFVKIYELFRQNRIPEAMEIQKQADIIIAALIKAGVIPAMKAILTELGFPMGDARAPFTPLDGEKKRELLEAVMPLL